MSLSPRLSTTASWFVIIFLMVVALIYFKALIEPFVLAIFIWYLIRATRKTIGRITFKGRSMPKWLQASLAFLLTFAVLYGFFQIISFNIELIIRKWGFYDDNLRNMVRTIRISPLLTGLPGIENFDKFILDNLSKFDLQAFVTGVFNSLSFIVGNFALIVVYVIFLLIEESFIPGKIDGIMKVAKRRETMTEIVRRISVSINTYFTVKTTMSLLTGLLSYIALLLLGIDFAVLWAFLIFLFNYIPYVGSFIATLLPSLFAIFQFSAFLPFLWVFLVVESIQVLVGNYIEPKVMGKTLNLSPLIVILSLSFWGALWGVVGMILSVPIMSVIVIIMAHFQPTRPLAILCSEQGNLDSYIDIVDDLDSSNEKA